MILCSNPKAQYVSHKMAIDAAVERVLASGSYVLGAEVCAFEAEFAAYIGTRYAIGVGCGIEAIEIALRVLGVGAGDEVITTTHTAMATVAAIELAGATPVFADIEPDYLTLDPAAVERAISPATKAIVPVHLYGQPADLTAILPIAARHGLKVIEDCAQAHGTELGGRRRLGSIGDIGCFSYYPTKNLGAIGDGGMIVTSKGEVADACRLLREYGWAERSVSHVRGKNSRLDELQAAILRAKLPTLDTDNQARARIAAAYETGLANTAYALPRPRPQSRDVYHLYVIRTSRRDALLSHVRDRESAR
jgi:dTDP-4-amino-4,6-dideoxygalactose transaminase